MMLCDPIQSSTLNSFPVSDRGGAAGTYVLTTPRIQSEPREDFWVRTSAWTCATIVDLQIQKAIARKNAVAAARVWKRNLVEAPSDVLSSSAIFETVRSVRGAIANFGSSAIDLRDIDYTYVNPNHLIAILRATYPWKDEVEGWGQAVAMAPSVLESNGMNPRRELAGLM